MSRHARPHRSLRNGAPPGVRVGAWRSSAALLGSRSSFLAGPYAKDIGPPLIVGDKILWSGSLPGVRQDLLGEVWSDASEPDPDPSEAPCIGGGGEGLRSHFHQGCLVVWRCFHRDELAFGRTHRKDAVPDAKGCLAPRLTFLGLRHCETQAAELFVGHVCTTSKVRRALSRVSAARTGAPSASTMTTLPTARKLS